MRIIAGSFGGRPILAPEGRGTRPTTDRVRESLMSAVESALGGLAGCRVLDCFSGSGALSFESLSRGAVSAVLFEKDPKAFSVIRKNRDSLGISSDCITPLKLDVTAFDFSRSGFAPFDVVYFDPPYATPSTVVFDLIARLLSANLLAPGAILCYEHAKGFLDESLALELGLQKISSKIYGDVQLDYLRKE